MFEENDWNQTNILKCNSEYFNFIKNGLIGSNWTFKGPKLYVYLHILDILVSYIGFAISNFENLISDLHSATWKNWNMSSFIV